MQNSKSSVVYVKLPLLYEQSTNLVIRDLNVKQSIPLVLTLFLLVSLYQKYVKVLKVYLTFTDV